MTSSPIPEERPLGVGLTAKPFELTVADRATTGVTVRPGRLVFRPTAPAIGLSVALTILGSAMLVFAALGAPVALVLFGLTTVIPGWRSATARVVADQDGLKIRNHWRTRRLPWTTVQSILVH